MDATWRGVRDRAASRASACPCGGAPLKSTPRTLQFRFLDGFYKYRHLLSASEDLVFDHDHQPGDWAKLSGIYRCAACGRETVVREGEDFPSDHGHAVTEGPVRWRLLVYADHRAK